MFLVATVLICTATHQSPGSLFPHTRSNIHLDLQRLLPSEYLYEGPETDSVLSKDILQGTTPSEAQNQSQLHFHCPLFLMCVF